uniref:Uncharacterized protein n=1 Tax=Kalanchoe fedtschenkoi TaxID=63787 RepID=A0A7N0UMT1_KALFE
MKPARSKLEELWRLSDAENEIQRQLFNADGQPLPTIDDNVNSSFSNVGSISPLNKSPWSEHESSSAIDEEENRLFASSSSPKTNLVCSLVRKEGHIYSLAASGDLLYTGSDSKNIRVWKNQKEFSGFKSNSGLVKSIILSNDKIFTGHQDGKIRIWKVSEKNQNLFKRIGTLPTLKAYLKSSMNPNNYVEIRRKRSVWIKHLDSISSLALSEDGTLLYSASWDRSFKVWRVGDFKCLESIQAHDDAVNSIVVGFNGLVFSGSADGKVKVWRREKQATKKGFKTKHSLMKTLATKDCAITSLAINVESMQVYSGSSDGLVNFWAGSELQHGEVLRGHKLAVLCLAAAGKLVFSGSADMTICVWRRVVEAGGEHVCLAMLTGHAGPVKCLAVEEEEKEASAGSERRWVLYSGSLDRSVKVWKVPEHAKPNNTQIRNAHNNESV